MEFMNFDTEEKKIRLMQAFTLINFSYKNMKIKDKLQMKLKMDKVLGPYIVNEDEDILNDLDADIEFLKVLYKIRKFIGYDYDYGMNDFMTAQMDVDKPEITPYEKCLDYIKKYFSKNTVEDKNQVKSGVTECVTHMFEKITGVFLYCGEYVMTLIRSTIQKFSDLISNVITTVGSIKSFVISKLVWIFGMVLVGSIGIFSLKVFELFYKYVGYNVTNNITLKEQGNYHTPGTYGEVKNMKAQGGPEPISCLIGLCAFIYTWKSGIMNRITKASKDLITLVATGTVFKNIWLLMFSLLPLVLKDALVFQFGSQDMIDEANVSQWRKEATALISASKVTSLTIDQGFRDRVASSLSKGSELMRVIKNPAIRSSFIGLHNKMQSFYSTIMQFEAQNATRDLPFSLHIFGKPGVGKTMLVKRLLSKAFDSIPHSTYNIPPTPFWDGYVGQEYLIWDEFLSGTVEMQGETANNYLALISTATFMPNLASVDNMTTGIKGTIAAPKVVVTMNNVSNFRVSGFSNEAMDRRRNIVLKLERCEENWRPQTGNSSNVDLKKYTQEEIENMIWIQARILEAETTDGLQMSENLYEIIQKDRKEKDPEYVGQYFRGSPLPIALVIRILRELYDEHKERNEIMKNFTMSVKPESNAAKLNKLMENTYDLPTEPINLADALMNIAGTIGKMGSEMFSSVKNFIAQGNNNKKKNEKKKNKNSNKLEIEKRMTTPNNWDSEESLNIVPCETSSVNSYKDCNSIELDDEEMPKRTIATLELKHIDCKGDNTLETLQTVYNQEKERKFIKFSEEYAEEFKKRDDLPICCYYMETVEKKGVYIGTFEFDGACEVCGEKIAKWKNKPSYQTLSVTILCFTSVVVILYAVYRMFSKESMPEECTFIAQAAPSVGSSHDRKNDKRRKPSYKLTKGRLDAQSRLPSLVEVSVYGYKFYAVPIFGKTFLTFHHALLHIYARTENKNVHSLPVKLFVGNSIYDVNIVVNECLTDKESDVWFFQINDTRVPNFPDITNKFVDESMLLDQDSFMVAIGEGDTAQVGTALYSTDMQTYKAGGKITPKMYGLDVSFKYKIETASGDCGLLVESRSGTLAGKYLGIHVAGGYKDDIPVGMATVVTKQLLLSVKEQMTKNDVCMDDNVKKALQDNNVPIEAQGRIVGIDKNLPNCSEIIYTAPICHTPKNSKIKPSVLNNQGSFVTKKKPALLEIEEILPISINNLFSVENCEPDKEILEEITEITYTNLKKNLDVRRLGLLTIEEATFGIPGKLCSLDVSTSAGYPWVKLTEGKPGKSKFISLPNNEDDRGYISPILLNFVNRQWNIMMGNEEPENGSIRNIGIDDHIFLGYLKDEVVSQNKIDDKRTRMIFANAVHALINFRRLFGSFIIAFNSSWSKIPSAVGMNPNSYDMDVIYQYLVEEGGDEFFAGDYKNFDQRHQYEFRMAAYRIIQKINWQFVSVDLEFKEYCKAWEIFVQHELGSWFQIDSVRARAKSNHFSGGFFTTIINCLVNELYLRYCFKRLGLDDSVRFKVLGDDNIICFKKGETNPLAIKLEMLRINQILTNDDKTEITWETEFKKNFEEVSFLGTRPVRYKNKWVGLQKKESIMEMIQWKKSKNASIVEVCNTACRLYSFVGEKEFEDFRREIIRILERNKIFDKDLYSDSEPLLEKQSMLRELQANTDTYKKEVLMDFVNMSAQGREGLTNLMVEVGSSDVEKPKDQLASLSNLAVSEDPMELKYGLDSVMYRTTFEWKVNDDAFKTILQKRAPFEIILDGDLLNIQNMPFERYIYLLMNLEVIVQVNANPFQQGLLALLFQPLRDVEINATNILSYDHVLIQPNESSTATLKIPTRFYRSVLNTFAGGLGEDVIGIVKVIVIVPLETKGTINSIELSMSTRFPDTKFTIPRPVNSIKKDMMRLSTLKEMVESTKDKDFINAYKKASDGWHAQGNVSSSNISNNYSFQDIAGSIPIENIATNSPHMESSPSLSLDVPFDKPPLSSGSIPIHQIFPGMSKVSGLDPVVAMQPQPVMLNREHTIFLNNVESQLEWLMSRPFIWKIIDWSIIFDEDTELGKMSLNSLLQDLTSENEEIAPALAVLNMFAFWRADIKITIRAIKTKFHSGRISCSVGYGTNLINPEDRNVYYNNIFNFSADNSVNSFIIPYNASTEYLQIYKGPDVLNPIQDNSLGFCLICVHNILRAPENVPQSIKLVVSVELQNVMVYELNSFCPIVDRMREKAIKVDVVANNSVAGNGFNKDEIAKYKYKVNEEIIPSFKLMNEIDARIVNRFEKRKHQVTDAEGKKYTREIIEPVADQRRKREITVSELLSGDLMMTGQGEDNGLIDSEEVAIQDGDGKTVLMTAPSENKVSKKIINIGRKFEFNFKNINEIGKRFVPFVYNRERYNLAGIIEGGSFKATHRILQIPVGYGSLWSSLFVGWAGHVNYKIFIETQGLVYSRLVNNYSVLRYGESGEIFPIGIYHNGRMLSVFAYNNSSVTTFYTASNGSDYDYQMEPFEVHMPMSNGLNVITLSVPFNTNYNFIPLNFRTSDSERKINNNIPDHHSNLMIVVPLEATSVSIFRAVGDDFSVIGYCPPILKYVPLGDRTTASATVRSYDGYRIKSTPNA